MKKYFSCTPVRGYVGIVSALILSAILSIFAFTESTDVFWSRYDELNQENQETSRISAGSCAYEVLREYSKNPSSIYAGMKFPDSSCTLDSIVSDKGSLTFSIHVKIQNTYAGIVVTTTSQLSSGILSITSWRDITSTPP